MGGIWRAHLPPVDGVRRCVAVAGDRYPDGSTVELAALPAERDARVLVEAEYEPPAGPVLLVRPRALGGAVGPGLWFVRQPQPDDDPPAMVLVAFETQDVPAGRLVGPEEFRRLSPSVRDQVGAVRWWPGSGVVHQVYVQPQHRRRGIGRELVQAAGGYVVARRWPPLRVGGTRTDLGEAALQHAPEAFTTRVASRSAVAGPMTPADRTAGVPARHLVPDAPGPVDERDGQSSPGG